MFVFCVCVCVCVCARARSRVRVRETHGFNELLLVFLRCHMSFREMFRFIVEQWTMNMLVTMFEIANSVWTTKKELGARGSPLRHLKTSHFSTNRLTVYHSEPFFSQTSLYTNVVPQELCQFHKNLSYKTHTLL